MQRINVVGTSGSGKSTFARQLARALDYPCLEMDALFWKPDWQESSDEEFFFKLEKTLARPTWVLDGNYKRSTPIKWAQVDTVIWLDYSFTRTLYQALKRAVHRASSKQELWPGTGNVETFGKLLLSRNSILLWTIKTYHTNRQRYQAIMQAPEFAHIRFVRLASPAQARQFIIDCCQKY